MPTESIGKGFDRLVGMYDPIVQLVFGNRIELLQAKTLERLGPVNRVLIVGGGTGKILTQCLELNRPEYTVFAELSEKMMASAEKRVSISSGPMVQFTQTDYRTRTDRFDAIIFPFVLDCYSTDEVKEHLMAAKGLLTKKGRVALIDFNLEAGTVFRGSWIKKCFIDFLYAFFRLTTSMKASQLAPFHR